MRDQHGNLCDSCTKAPPASVVIEESGPLRACLCIKGHHTTPQGHRFCPYILRIHLFAGKSHLRIHHTFIYDQDPREIELSAVGLKFPLEFGHTTRAAVGGSDEAHVVTPIQPTEFLQVNDQEYRVVVEGEAVGSGTRTSGWACLTGADGSAIAVIKDQWQEYPKGFGLSREGIDVQIWPESHGQTLKFTTPFQEPAISLKGIGHDEEAFKKRLDESPNAPINLKTGDPRTVEDLLWVEGMVEKYASDRAVSHNDTSMFNGVGAAKTTEIHVQFTSSPIEDVRAEQFARAVQEPLIAPADPAHTCATAALGHAYHAGDPRFTDIDEGLDDSLELAGFEPVERCRLYGMMRYGNAVCSHAPGPGVAYACYKDTAPEKALRFVGSFNNESYDMIMGMWGHFVRTARRDHCLLAQAYSRHVADVAVIHARLTDTPDVLGLMHYHNAHVWSGGPSPSHTLMTGILTDYYFTGNRRLLDVAREVADWALRTQEHCGIISNRDGALHREFTGPLWSVLEVYQATWHEPYGDLARRSLNWFLRTLQGPGKYPISVYTAGDRGDEAVIEPAPDQPTCKGHPREIYPLLEIGLRLFDSQSLRDHIIAEANSYVWDEPIDRYLTAEEARQTFPSGASAWPVDDQFYWVDAGRVWGTYRSAAGPVCLAYNLTGDPVYAAYAKHLLEHSFARQMVKMRNFAFFDFSHLWYGSGILRLMKTVSDAWDADGGALAKAEETWMRRRSELGRPVYTGPCVDLTKYKMEASGKITSHPPVNLSAGAQSQPRKGSIKLGRISLEDHPAPR